MLAFLVYFNCTSIRFYVKYICTYIYPVCTGIRVLISRRTKQHKGGTRHLFGTRRLLGTRHLFEHLTNTPRRLIETRRLLGTRHFLEVLRYWLIEHWNLAEMCGYHFLISASYPYWLKTPYPYLIRSHVVNCYPYPIRIHGSIMVQLHRESKNFLLQVGLWPF